MRIVCDRCDKIMNSTKAKLLSHPNGVTWYLCSDCFDKFHEFIDELRYPNAEEFTEPAQAREA